MFCDVWGMFSSSVVLISEYSSHQLCQLRPTFIIKKEKSWLGFYHQHKIKQCSAFWLFLTTPLFKPCASVLLTI